MAHYPKDHYAKREWNRVSGKLLNGLPVEPKKRREKKMTSNTTRPTVATEPQEHIQYISPYASISTKEPIDPNNGEETTDKQVEQPDVRQPTEGSSLSRPIFDPIRDAVETNNKDN